MGKMPIARSNIAQTTFAAAVTLASLTLLGVVLAYWTWTWLGPRVEPRTEPMVDSVSRSAGTDTLFGILQAGQASAAPTGLAIKLIGVVSSTGRKPGYAVMQLDAKTIRAVRAGEEIAPGIRLDKVFPDHVTLERTGTSESLALAERKNPAPSAPAKP
jgi:general secretion pathway protein C